MYLPGETYSRKVTHSAKATAKPESVLLKTSVPEVISISLLSSLNEISRNAAFRIEEMSFNINLMKLTRGNQRRLPRGIKNRRRSCEKQTVQRYICISVEFEGVRYFRLFNGNSMKKYWISDCWWVTVVRNREASLYYVPYYVLCHIAYVYPTCVSDTWFKMSN